MTPPWQPEVEAKIAELLALPAGWNSYGAAPISSEATQRAMTLLEATMRGDTPAPSVVPISDGGVQLEWHCRGMDIEIEVPSREPIEVYVEDQRGGTVQEFSDDPVHLRRVLTILSSRP